MAYYKSVQFKPIWVEKSQNAQKRRAALFDALSNSAGHALPRDSYDAAGLEILLKSARTTADLGMLEGKMTKAFLAYARDISTGVLIPSKVDADIVRVVPKIDGAGFLTAFVKSSPRNFSKRSPPKVPNTTVCWTKKKSCCAWLPKVVGVPSCATQNYRRATVGRGLSLCVIV